MTLNRAQLAHIARLEASRDIIAQAAAAGRVARGECPTWRENALEMAGEYALVVGGKADSRKFARQFEEARCQIGATR